MLKQAKNYSSANKALQPPSGGCVLKPTDSPKVAELMDPAAFGRLCVETAVPLLSRLYPVQPPSGGCVLKQLHHPFNQFVKCQPPSGGCVLKQSPFKTPLNRHVQPPSGGCVLKHYFARMAYVL